MLKTIDKNIIVEETQDSEYVQKGIIVKSNTLGNLIGNVVCVGENVKGIIIGDRIIFSSSTSRKLFYDNTQYFVVNEKDVLAIIWGDLWKK